MITLGLNEDEIVTRDRVIAFAKKSKTSLCRRLADKKVYLSEEAPVPVFMSGSPEEGGKGITKELVATITEGQGQVFR